MTVDWDVRVVEDSGSLSCVVDDPGRGGSSCEGDWGSKKFAMPTVLPDEWLENGQSHLRFLRTSSSSCLS
jgi:hypothetical protein